MAVKTGTGVVLKMGNDPTVNSLSISPQTGDATTSWIKQTTTGGYLSFQSDPNGNLTIGGTITQKNTSGGTCLTVDQYGNLGAAQTITAGAGFSSPTGFKTQMDAGQVYQTNSTAGTFYQTNAFIYTSAGINGTVTSVGFAWKAPFAGSVVGGNLLVGGTTTGASLLRVTKNSTVMVTFSMGTGAGVYAATAAKGTYAFAAGDNLFIYVANATAGTLVMQAGIVLELSA